MVGIHLCTRIYLPTTRYLSVYPSCQLGKNVWFSSFRFFTHKPPKNSLPTPTRTDRPYQTSYVRVYAYILVLYIPVYIRVYVLNTVLKNCSTVRIDSYRVIYQVVRQVTFAPFYLQQTKTDRSFLVGAPSQQARQQRTAVPYRQHTRVAERAKGG